MKIKVNDKALRKIAEKVLKKDFSNVKIIEKKCVYLDVSNGVKTVGGKDIPQKLRAFTLLANISQNCDIHIEQTPNFDRLGVMLDMSRGGVMRVEKVKEFIDKIVMFGANELLIYMEDIFVLEAYPHFGYLRGAYSDNELKEIDDYAFELGVEVIPCIQTLGHMAQYLSWGSETKNIKDTSSVLLCDSDETYKFIEQEIVKMRQIFRTNQIHIGMDETFDMGLGKYLKINGFVDKCSLIKRHMSKVTDICKKYNFEPMIWSDMFFRLNSDDNDYYDIDGEFSPEIKDGIPDIKMVYWDYYSTSPECYEKMIKRHFDLGKEVIFAGGLWTWAGFLPDYDKVKTITFNALDSCINNNIKHVFATCWGDDGCETDYFRGLSEFGIFSEYCYSSQRPDIKEIEKISQTITGVSSEKVNAVSEFHKIPMAKPIFWGDIFYNISGIDFSKNDYSEGLCKVLSAGTLKDDRFAELVFKITANKIYIYKNLQLDYLAGKSLKKYTDNILPSLLSDYEEIMSLHYENWKSINKMFGFECVQNRYAAVISRTKYAIETIKDFAEGKTKTIEELEYTPLFGENRGDRYNNNYSGKI